MNYVFNPSYKMVSDNRCITLFKYLLRNLEGFIPEIAPEGFENSPYYTIYYATIEREYRDYRKQRASTYKWTRFRKRQYEFEPLLSPEQFKQEFVFSPIPQDRAILMIYIKTIHDIFEGNSIIHDNKFNTYHRYMGGYKKCMIKAVNQTKPEWTNLGRRELFGHKIYDDIDMYSAYCYIFRLLKNKKLDFLYQKAPKEMISGLLSTLKAPMAELQIKQILKETSSDQNENVLQNEEALLKILEPSSVVYAYFNVYNKAPENYLS